MKALLFSFLLVTPSIWAMELLPGKELRPIKIFEEKLKDNIVIIAYGNECPILRKHAPYLSKLHDKYRNKNVSFILINAVKGLEESVLINELSSYNLKMNLYDDSGSSTLKELAFKTISESALINKNKDVVYQGSINDQFTFDLTLAKSKTNHLEQAINATLKSKKVKVSKTKVFGCEISY